MIYPSKRRAMKANAHKPFEGHHVRPIQPSTLVWEFTIWNVTLTVAIAPKTQAQTGIKSSTEVK